APYTLSLHDALPILQLLDARVRPLGEHDERLDGLAAHGIGDADHGGLLDRRVTEQHLLYLAREDLEARDVDHVLHAVDDEEIAVGVAVADVAGMKPAVADRLRGGRGVAEIALHDVGPFDHDLAALAAGDLPALEVDDLHLDVLDRRADGAW